MKLANSPSEELRNSRTKDRLLKTTAHYLDELSDRALKDTAKGILKANLTERMAQERFIVQQVNLRINI